MQYVIEVRQDGGGVPLSLRIPATTEARDPALAVALEVLKTLKVGFPGSGNALTIRASP